jgi:hypothetical protein
MTSPLGEHNFGTHYLLTGYRPTPALDYPVFGSVVAQCRGLAADLPPNIAVPNHKVGGADLRPNGYLSQITAPFEVSADPNRGGLVVRDLEFFPGVTPERLRRRREYLALLDQRLRDANERGDEGENGRHSGRQTGRQGRHDSAFPGGSLGTSEVGSQGTSGDTDPAFMQAYRLMSSPDARRAFDLDEETPSTRQRYGPRNVGQYCLLARRLVERGVPFVTVNHSGWDTHDNLITRLKEGYTGAVTPEGLAPSLDWAISGLLDDLSERGLLQQTLVLVMGEFGRTPKLNTSGGRDHWPRVFSVLIAGAGIEGGQVIGASDPRGESPHERPVTPQDLAATIYTLLGIDPTATLHTADGRPVRINSSGEPMRELVSGVG